MKAFLKNEELLKDSMFDLRPERLSVDHFIHLTQLVEKEKEQLSD